MKKTKTIDDQYKELIGPGKWTVLSFRFGSESDARRFHYDVMDEITCSYALFDICSTVATLIIMEDDDNSISSAKEIAERHFGKMREFYPKLLKN